MGREQVHRLGWISSPTLFALIGLVTTCSILLFLFEPSAPGISTAKSAATGEQGPNVPALGVFGLGRGSVLKREGDDYTCDKVSPCYVWCRTFRCMTDQVLGQSLWERRVLVGIAP